MSMFEDVKKMNVAFGNAEGTLDNINWERLTSQCKNILDEYIELTDAITAKDPIAVRDALCDISVFNLGAAHMIGADHEADMKAVFDSNMSKFCKDGVETAQTIKKYQDLGIIVIPLGDYPLGYVKTPEGNPQVDDKGKMYQANKFLKGIGFKEPVFK